MRFTISSARISLDRVCRDKIRQGHEDRIPSRSQGSRQVEICDLLAATLGQRDQSDREDRTVMARSSLEMLQVAVHLRARPGLFPDCLQRGLA